MKGLSLARRLGILVVLSGAIILGSMVAAIPVLNASNATAGSLMTALETSDGYAFELLAGTGKLQGMVQSFLRERDVDVLEKLMADIRTTTGAFAAGDTGLSASLEALERSRRVISSDFATAMDRAGLTDGDRAANRASEDGSGGADVVARQMGGYNFYYHLNNGVMYNGPQKQNP
jgi:hypothetical protein